MENKLRHIRIPRDVEEIVERYRVAHDLKYFSDALLEIVRQNNELPSASAAQTLAELLAGEVAKRLKEEMNSDAVAIRLSARSADRNAQVLVRAVNQMLSAMRIPRYADNDMAIMAQAKAITDNEIERYRQLRIDQSRRKHGQTAAPSAPEASPSKPASSAPPEPELPEDGGFIL